MHKCTTPMTFNILYPISKHQGPPGEQGIQGVRGMLGDVGPVGERGERGNKINLHSKQFSIKITLLEAYEWFITQ